MVVTDLLFESNHLGERRKEEREKRGSEEDERDKQSGIIAHHSKDSKY